MKTETIKVGTGTGNDKFFVECTVKIAENDADIAVITQQSKDAKKAEVIRCERFNRAERIWRQEQTGARDIVRESNLAERKDRPALTAKVQACIDSADNHAPQKRAGRVAAPVNVTVTTEMQKAAKAGDFVKLQAMLAEAGVKNVTFTK